MLGQDQGTRIGIRTIALAGPAGAGKTTLAEAMLFASGTIDRQGSVDAGNTVADASPEARARHGSTELSVLRLTYMHETFVLLDTPGAPGFAADGARALAASDLVIVVVDPDPARAILVEPTLRALEARAVPHAIFVNKIDQARGPLQELLAALQPMSGLPLVARQIPIREGDSVTGFVDLALERAWHYRPGKPSEPITLPEELAAREAEARFHMLEQLADHDDVLLEALLSDEMPSLATIFEDLRRETGSGLVVPVLFGSALNDFGVRRLLKMLRHDAPSPAATAERLGVDHGAYVLKVSNGGTVGRLAVARLFGDGLDEGAELVRGGDSCRAGALFALHGGTSSKVGHADSGDVVGIAKTDLAVAGDVLATDRAALAAVADVAPPTANCARAIATRDRKDDVRLTAALSKLCEEDPALRWRQDERLHETLLIGVNDEHLAVAIERLRRRYGVAVTERTPGVAYRESIRKGVTRRGRHKKQSGGHGQFGDVVIEVRPLARGEGFRFEERITGGAVPKQWIPAVEQGVRDAMERGPLGFPVDDVAVTLIDGSYHSVDSSELAFRTAGRIAMAEALAECGPYLLEPVMRIAIEAPGAATSRISSALASRRGQMLGIAPVDGWSRWDRIEALLPEVELHGLDAELRSLSQGLARYEAEYDHLAEVNGKLAGEIVQRHKEAA